MLILASTTDRLQVVAGSAGTINVHASYLDNVSGAVQPGRKNTTITSTAITDVVSPPGANIQRTLKTLHVHNHGATSNAVTVQVTDGTTLCTLHSVSLPPNATLQYIDELGFVVSDLYNRIAIQNLNSAYTVAVIDNGGIINCNGSFTLSLLAAVTAGAGFQFRIRNTGLATITINPAGSETINGTLTLRCCSKEEFAVVCDGTGWFTAGRASVIRLERQKVTAAVPAVAMTLPPDYEVFDVQFDRVTVTPSVAIAMFMYDNIGPYPGQYQQVYWYVVPSLTSAATAVSQVNSNYALLSGGTAATTRGDADYSGNVRIYPNNQPTFRGPTWLATIRYLYDNAWAQVQLMNAGEISVGNRAITVQFNAANFTSGTFHLDGRVPGEPP